MSHPTAPSERLTNTINFINRAREQLVEKRSNVRTLVDAENLQVDEKKFYVLFHINLLTLPPADQLQCIHLFLDLGEIKDDFKVTSAYRKKYTAERQSELDEINHRESQCTPCPSFKVAEITQYCDNTAVTPNQTVPEFSYRLRQADIYFERLKEQHCCLASPSERESIELPPPPQGCERAPLNFIEIENLPPPCTRSSSKGYLLNPEATHFEEYKRVLKAFLEETITQGPEKNVLLEHLPLVQFEA